MTRRLFGTDGIRGTANSEPMTPETALKVAMAVGECFHKGTHKHLVVVGKDTRLSGYMLEPALTAGFVIMCMDVVLVGPLPTPAIAMLTRSLRADLGVVLSASHNPYSDNGIKLFGRDGYKLSDEFEQKIEAASLNDRTGAPSRLNSGGSSGSKMRAAATSNSSSRASLGVYGWMGCASSSIALMAQPIRSHRPCFGSSVPRFSHSVFRLMGSISTASVARWRLNRCGRRY